MGVAHVRCQLFELLNPSSSSSLHAAQLNFHQARHKLPATDGAKCGLATAAAAAAAIAVTVAVVVVVAAAVAAYRHALINWALPGAATE